MADNMIPRLRVRRADLIPTLVKLARFIRNEYQPEAILSFHEGVLTIDIGGMAARMPASGVWPVEVRVNARLFQGVAANPPTDEPFVLEVVEKQFRIGISSPRYSAPCTVQSVRAGNKPIQIAINPRFRDLAALNLKHSKEDLTRSGLGKVASSAAKERERLIDSAVYALARLEIPKEEIRAMVHRHLLSRDDNL